jgi:hypothetical protein
MKMENKDKSLLVVGALVSLFFILISSIYFNDESTVVVKTSTICREDSLQNVINQLKIDIENEQDGWDDKEKRYEQILFEYQFGLDHLKHYHSDAYKEFHRIVGYKESYTSETERENMKRLKTSKW